MASQTVALTAHQLIVLGGAPRAGKSQMAARLWAEHSLPSFAMDAFVASFIRLVPGTVVNWGESTERAEQITVAAEFIAEAGVENHGRFLIEGESMNPAVAAKLSERFLVNACFMVLLSPRLDDLIRHETSNAWVGGLAKARQRRAVKNISERSEWLVSECECFGFPWVDMSSGDYGDRCADVTGIFGLDHRTSIAS